LTTIVREVLEMPAGFRSREAASFFAQLNDQSARLAEDTRLLTPDALAWQPSPGMNTIGMLIAHIAIVEVFWTQVGPLGMTTFESESILGIGIDDDGMPLAEGGSPPATLRGKDLAWYDDLLSRSRAYAQKAMAALSDADLERDITRTRRDGSVHVTTMRWVLYHMVEHLAGHYGQINLLAHQYRIKHPSV
jgi:uncharacterized damage-inducible protein DinB